MTEDRKQGSDVRKKVKDGLFCLLTSVIRLLIWLYRHSLSYFLGRNCRFLPTCSAYADEAIRVHGPVKGSQLALHRFCRCHPFKILGGGSGFDPVPEKHSGVSIRHSGKNT